MRIRNEKKISFKQRLGTYDGQKFCISVLFLLVPTLLLLLFTFVPAMNMIGYSFQERDQFGVDPKFVGFENYKTIFTNPDYFITFKNSLYYLVGSFIQQIIALLIASILCSKIKATFANIHRNDLGDSENAIQKGVGWYV